jgi:hypothetical protein
VLSYATMERLYIPQRICNRNEAISERSELWQRVRAKFQNCVQRAPICVIKVTETSDCKREPFRSGSFVGGVNSYRTHTRLKQHLQAFLMAYNFAKRLKTLQGLTLYRHICKVWTKQPRRSRLNPLHRTLGLNT